MRLGLGAVTEYVMASLRWYRICVLAGAVDELAVPERRGERNQAATELFAGDARLVPSRSSSKDRHANVRIRFRERDSTSWKLAWGSRIRHTYRWVGACSKRFPGEHQFARVSLRRPCTIGRWSAQRLRPASRKGDQRDAIDRSPNSHPGKTRGNSHSPSSYPV